jgi:demethylmacrocin O-methyltransferase
LVVVRRIYDAARALGHGNNLNRLATIYGTDKYGSHFYTPHYMTHFRKYKYRRINLIEIGVGGYADPVAGGNSLRMWKRYFPFGSIYSIDIYDKSSLEERRIRIFTGSQVDRDFLMTVHDRTGDFDLIIDDGSHINEHVIQSFEMLFPFLREGGTYVIEDTQTSYWPDFGGDDRRLGNPRTTMGFFKSLSDCVNYREFAAPDHEPSYYDQNVTAVHFYHNLIFVCKGKNIEESNIVGEV